MYLARHLGRWSTTAIGRFYNGRDHSTVCHGIQKIEALRQSDPDVDLLLSDLKHELSGLDSIEAETEDKASDTRVGLSRGELERLADLIAERVCTHLRKRMSA